MAICLVTCLFSAVVYTNAGWDLLDASYMVVITLFGIGYSEVHPLTTTALKLQTMVLIVVGGLSGLYSVGGFLQLLTQGEINRALGARKMGWGIRKMKNHIIICGYGRVGQMLATELARKNIPLIVVDKSQQRLNQAAEHGYTTLCGDAACETVLNEAGVTRARSLVCALPEDAVNVFITLTARELNEDVIIIARAECPKTESKLRRSGANHIVLPAAIGAVHMSRIISRTPDSRPDGRKCASALSTSLRAITIDDDDDLADATLEMARELLAEVGDLVGLQRGNSEIMTLINEQQHLEPGDILLVST